MNHETRGQKSEVRRQKTAREDARPTSHNVAPVDRPTVDYGGKMAAVIWESEMAAVADRRYMEIKASQARSDLIKATIIFFGLDSDCPSHSDNLCA